MGAQGGEKTTHEVVVGQCVGARTAAMGCDTQNDAIEVVAHLTSHARLGTGSRSLGSLRPLRAPPHDD